MPPGPPPLPRAAEVRVRHLLGAHKLQRHKARQRCLRIVALPALPVASVEIPANQILDFCALHLVPEEERTLSNRFSGSFAFLSSSKRLTYLPSNRGWIMDHPAGEEGQRPDPIIVHGVSFLMPPDFLHMPVL
jgi:hypothetical protein